MNNIINNIMMKYLMKDSVISIEGYVYGEPDTMIYLDEKTKENLNNIFMMISDVDTDVCFVSQNLVTEDLLSFRTGTNPGINCANGKFYKDEALAISMTCQNFITDISNGVLGSYDSLQSELKFDKALKHITDMIEGYFNGSQEDIYFKQLALNDHNMVGLLLFIINIEIDLADPHIEIFQDLHEDYNLLATIATTNIFQNDNQILYSNPEIFNVIFDLYKDKFEEFDDYFNADSHSGDEKHRLDWILAVDTFNKYFLHLLSNPTLSRGSNGQKHQS